MEVKLYTLSLSNVASMRGTSIRTLHTIDATDQAVGRVATRVAMLLRGKHKATFVPHIDEGDSVVVMNVAKVKFTGRKLEQVDYYRHTMYPGGLKRTPMKRVFTTDPTDVLRRAVYGMLPKNKQRDNIMKRLTIKA